MSIPGEQWNAHSPCVAIFHVLASKLAFDSKYPFQGVWSDLVVGAGEGFIHGGAAETEVVTEWRVCVHDDKEDGTCSQG